MCNRDKDVDGSESLQPCKDILRETASLCLGGGWRDKRVINIEMDDLVVFLPVGPRPLPFFAPEEEKNKRYLRPLPGSGNERIGSPSQRTERQPRYERKRHTDRDRVCKERPRPLSLLWSAAPMGG